MNKLTIWINLMIFLMCTLKISNTQVYLNKLQNSDITIHECICKQLSYDNISKIMYNCYDMSEEAKWRYSGIPHNIRTLLIEKTNTVQPNWNGWCKVGHMCEKTQISPKDYADWVCLKL